MGNDKTLRQLAHMARNKWPKDEWVKRIEGRRSWLSYYLDEVDPVKIGSLPILRNSEGRPRGLGFNQRTKADMDLMLETLCWPIDEYRHEKKAPKDAKEGTAYFFVITKGGWVLLTVEFDVKKHVGVTNPYEEAKNVRIEYKSVLEISEITDIPLKWFWIKLEDLIGEIDKKSQERRTSIADMKVTVGKERAAYDALTSVGDPDDEL